MSWRTALCSCFYTNGKEKALQLKDWVAILFKQLKHQYHIQKLTIRLQDVIWRKPPFFFSRQEFLSWFHRRKILQTVSHFSGANETLKGWVNRFPREYATHGVWKETLSLHLTLRVFSGETALHARVRISFTSPSLSKIKGYSQTNLCTYSVSEDEAPMTKLQMFEQTV